MPIETIAGEGSDDHTNPDRRARRGGSRRSAWRDGLAAQPVIEKLEKVRSYRAFERAIIASIEPRSAIELELGHRRANVLWRLRRASMIETGLLEIPGELLLARRTRSESETVLSPIRANGHNQNLRGSHERPRPKFNRAIAQCFANLDSVLLERVGTYEARLWRKNLDA